MWEPQGIFSDYFLKQPTMLFGSNAVWGLSDYPAATIAIIHGETVNDSVGRISSVLKNKAFFFLTRSWRGEPTIEELKETLHELEEIKPDTIIAVGGGSVIDGAKLCRLYYEFPYYVNGNTRINQLPFKTKFIAIPTTIGSGAEASSAAVYWNDDAGRKEMVVSRSLRPDVVVLDPDMVANTPYRLLAASALDAVSHLTEGYVSNRKNVIAERNAEFALSILCHELCKDEECDLDYLALQYAGYIGGVVQDHCIVGMAHAIAHQLTAYGYSHGEAVALLLPAVIRLNGTDSTVKAAYTRLWKAIGINNEADFLGFLEKIVQKSGIADRKEDLRILLQQLLMNERFIRNVIDDRGGQGNPLPISRELIARLVGEYL